MVETPETNIAPVIDIMEALKKSLEMRKPPMVAHAAAGSAEESEDNEAVSDQPKRKRAPRKIRTA